MQLTKRNIRHWHFYGILLAVGALLGAQSVFSTVASPLVLPVYAICAAMFALQRPRKACLWAFVLTTCIYLSHVIGILCGMKAPYVEPNIAAAGEGYYDLLSIMVFGAAFGAMLRAGHDFSARTRIAREQFLVREEAFVRENLPLGMDEQQLASLPWEKTFRSAENSLLSASDAIAKERVSVGQG